MPRHRSATANKMTAAASSMSRTVPATMEPASLMSSAHEPTMPAAMIHRFPLRDCSGTRSGRCVTLLRSANRDTIHDLARWPDVRPTPAGRGCGAGQAPVNGSGVITIYLENARVPTARRPPHRPPGGSTTRVDVTTRPAPGTGPYAGMDGLVLV